MFGGSVLSPAWSGPVQAVLPSGSRRLLPETELKALLGRLADEERGPWLAYSSWSKVPYQKIICAGRPLAQASSVKGELPC